MFLLDSGMLIGHCGIEPKELKREDASVDVMELGYGIRHSHQQKGYAVEALNAILSYALENLGIKEFYLRTRSDNTASIKTAEKLGFTKDFSHHADSYDGTDSYQIYTKTMIDK